MASSRSLLAYCFLSSSHLPDMYSRHYDYYYYYSYYHSYSYSYYHSYSYSYSYSSSTTTTTTHLHRQHTARGREVLEPPGAWG